MSGLQERGRVVAMVGNGINDAPALTQADLDAAIGVGSTATLEAADMNLLSSGLRACPAPWSWRRAPCAPFARISSGSSSYNVLLIPAAAFGLFQPALAAGAMALSSLFVVGNSLQLAVAELERD